MSKGLGPHVQQHMPGYCCEKHLEPPRLFCDDDQVALCVQCLLSPEHRSHTVCGAAEAAAIYRKLFQEILNTLREKLEVAKSILAEEQERMLMIQVEEQNFKEMIESEYKISLRLLSEDNEMNLMRLNIKEGDLNHLMGFARELEEKFQEMLEKLTDLGRENMNKLKESEAKVSEHIGSLQRITAELEKKCGEPAPVLLQNARYSLQRSESLLLQCLEPAHITNLSLCQITGVSRMLTIFQRHITLDPDTAHPCLILSEDLRSVRSGNVLQDVPDNPERLDFSATVLGVESFTSGRHYWEVEVEKAARWQLGICADSAHQKGGRPKASGGKFVLMGSIMGTDFTVWVFPPLKRVSLRDQVHKVGVFLDYEYGQISFYNVTERALIYSFSCLTFQGALRPICSLCLPTESKNSDCLTFCTPHAHPCVTASPQSSFLGNPRP